MSGFHDYIGALTGAGTVMAVGVTAVARAWPTPSGRHRRTVPEADLLGPPTPYTTPQLPEMAVVAQCFDDCPTCGHATAGVLRRDGWTCGECLTPAPSGGAK